MESGKCPCGADIEGYVTVASVNSEDKDIWEETLVNKNLCHKHFYPLRRIVISYLSAIKTTTENSNSNSSSDK